MSTTDPIEKYTLTDEERDGFARQALPIAWRALQPLRKGDPDMGQSMKIILNAFKEVNDFHDACSKKLSEEHPGSRFVWVFETEHVVCSAFSFLDDSSLDGVHPYCQGGLRVKAFVKVTTALAKLSDVRDSLDEDVEPCGGRFAARALDMLATTQ